MGSLTELRVARQAIYLKSLAETGSVTAAAQATAIHISLPAHWRHRYRAFAKAERKAKQQAAKTLVERAR
jgi:hypothetical protein